MAIQSTTRKSPPVHGTQRTALVRLLRRWAAARGDYNEAPDGYADHASHYIPKGPYSDEELGARSNVQQVARELAIVEACVNSLPDVERVAVLVRHRQQKVPSPVPGAYELALSSLVPMFTKRSIALVE